MPLQTVILSGSSRPNNNTHRVALALQRIAHQHGANAHVVDFKAFDIPFLNQGEIHPNNLSAFQKELVDTMNQANLIVMVSPEYNWFPSAELINMIHQLGNGTFRHLFDNKTFAFVGVSTGRGGRIPTIQLSYVIDKLINVFETNSITCPKKFESQFTTQVLNELGESNGNAEYDKGIEKFMSYTINLATKWSHLHLSE
jgi:chromate reductase, NAD(P)H dehydrogenase (quinone)